MPQIVGPSMIQILLQMISVTQEAPQRDPRSFEQQRVYCLLFRAAFHWFRVFRPYRICSRCGFGGLKPTKDMDLPAALNPKPLNPKPLNFSPKPLNPKPLNP